jgi:hypothetical protein
MVKGLDKIAILGGGIVLLSLVTSFTKNNRSVNENQVFSQVTTDNIREIDQSIIGNIKALDTAQNYANQILKLEREKGLHEIDFIQDQTQGARRLISEIQNEIVKYNPFHKKRLRSPDLQFRLKQEVRERRNELLQQNEQRIAAQEFIDKSESQINVIQNRITELDEIIF